MPSQAQAVARQAQAAVKIVLEHGPKVAATLAVVITFMRENPGIPAWLHKQLDEVVEQMKRLPRGDSAKIRKMLEIIRDVLRQLDAHDTDQSKINTKTWTVHADSIEQRVRLAKALPKPDQKKALAQLVTETEALLADLMSTLADVSSASSDTTEPAK